MAAVLISCPATGGLIATGVDVLDLEELEADNLLTACPECGTDHPWSPADAVLSAFATERRTPSPPLV